MKVLVVHNFYQQPGGEDQVFRDEVAMLRAHGDTVYEFTVHNDQAGAMNAGRLAVKTFWNDEVYRQLRELTRREHPDVAHFHNTFPLISPAGYQAAQDEGVAVVQTLHNYRLACPAATLFRDGQVCENCVGRTLAWPGILHGCYRDSRPATSVAAGTAAYHRQRGTWSDAVDTYIALTEFMRQKLVAAGLPAAKVVVKPNFVGEDPGAGAGRGDYAVFVGRLAPEKGIRTMLAAWRQLGGLLPLKILGDGPLRDEVVAASRLGCSVEWLGWRPPADVRAFLADAMMMIFPSEWYEAFGLTILEACAAGTPVVGASIGGIPELVQTGRTGRLFTAGDAADLAQQVRHLLDHGDELTAMRPLCRQFYLDNFTSERNHPLLTSVYRRALAMRPSRTSVHEPAQAVTAVMSGP